MFAGSMVALVTPMLDDGAIDYPSLKVLIDRHIAADTDALVVLGTTGESATISAAERTHLISFVVDAVAGRMPVIVGTGTNNTAQSIEYTQQAKELGADAALVITPYYNKPTQDGMYQHFSAIAAAVDIPQILYNVPSRTNCDLAVDTTIRLAQQHANIIGLKDATANFARLPVLLQATELALYSGDDATALDFILCGGRGVISVSANIAPELNQKMCAAALMGEAQEARSINQNLLSWQRDLFVETNPVPTKFVLHALGWIASATVRLPLVAMTAEHQAYMTQAVANCKYLKGKQ